MKSASASALGQRRRKRRQRITQPVEGWLSWELTRGLAQVVRRRPFERLAGLGHFLGDLGYATMPRYRRVATRNLGYAYGEEWDRGRIRQAARACFRHLGLTLVEFLWLPRLTPERLRELVHVAGQEHLDAALGRGRGVILISAHFGNWEIMPAWVSGAGYPLSTIVRDADHGGINQFILSMRRSLGQQILPRQSATRPALACLRRNEVLGIMLDQNTLESPVFVPFFGRPAATAAGPAVLAMRTGAALVPLFCTRRPDRSFDVTILPALLAEPDAPAEAEVPRLTAALTRCIEEQVRAAPEQWMWIHNRWKLRPDGSKVL